MMRTSAPCRLMVVAAATLLAISCLADAARPHVFEGRPLSSGIREAAQAAGSGSDQAAAQVGRNCDNDDEVCYLPGLNGLPHVRMRAGYVTVSEVSDRRLWYLVADREQEQPDLAAGSSGSSSGSDTDASSSSSSTRVDPDEVQKRGKKRSDDDEDEGGGDEGPSPVLLWLTGGPGCSSLDAFIYEHGPFRFSYAESQPGGSGGPHARREVVLQPNPFSWTKLATVIYVDSPAGTGMSYSGRPEVDYHSNDEYTIADLVTFLTGLTERYPELATAPFYLAGESYGGVFVPMLARELVRVNKERRKAGREPLVNLKGYSVGNPVTDDVIDGNAQLVFAADMGYIDPPTWRNIRETCDDMFWNATPGTDCYEAQAVVKDDLWDLNWYDVLQPCVHVDYGNNNNGQQQKAAQQQAVAAAGTSSSNSPAGRTAAERAERFFWPYTVRMARGDRDAAGAGPGMAAPSEEEAVLEASRRGGRRLWGRPWLRHVVPCADRRLAIDWLNRDEVRSALHAASFSSIGEWQPCSDVLYYRLDTMELVPVHEELVREGLRVLVYSGDHDMVVPHSGTRRWLFDVAALGGAEGPLRVWMLDGQVAGWTTRFKAGTGLRYASVKGAGHMVPQSKPLAALRLLRAFFRDEEL